MTVMLGCCFLGAERHFLMLTSAVTYDHSLLAQILRQQDV
jgi:hypothetical protein